MANYSRFSFSRALASVGVLASLTLAADNCKPYPGSSDWPSSETWDALNEALGGRLLNPDPPGAACHPGWSTTDAEQCPNVAEAWATWEFHHEHPTSVMWDQWSSYACMPDPELSCSDSAYPPYVINATTAEHVKLGIDFARENNVRIVVKNTGHDYIGRSIAPGALSIWTHHITEFSYHGDGYALSGSGKVIDGHAITFGAGVQMWQAYQFAVDNGDVVVGGGGWTVGLAGYATGAGHGPLSPHYGLASDNIIEMEVVTPGGEILRVNEDQNTDLFWALRGGGGSTFAVITSIVYQSYPSPKLFNVGWEAWTEPDAPFLHEFIAFMQTQYPAWIEAGLGGWNIFNTGVEGPPGVPGVPEDLYGAAGTLLLIGQDDGPAYVDDVFQPTIDIINSRWPGAVNWTHTVKAYDNLMDWFEVNYDQSTAGRGLYFGSRLLDGEQWKDEETLTVALGNLLDMQGLGYSFLVSGSGTKAAGEKHGGNSVHPSWRDSHVLLLTGVQFPALDKAAQDEAIATLDTVLEPLRQITPNGGSYLNEALPYEQDWQGAFWGGNYERLLEIKRAVDPDDVLWCFPCVGHDTWEQLPSGQLCRKD